MKKNDKLEAIYYPDCYMDNKRAFAALALYFDRMHFVSPSDEAADSIEYTQYLKRLPDSINICGYGDFSTQEAKKDIELLGNFYRFVMDIRPLLGDVVYYHGNLLGTQAGSIMNKLFGEGLTVDELFRFISGDTPQGRAFRKFQLESYPDAPTLIRRIVPATRFLAEAEGFIPVSDKMDWPAPILEPLRTSAKDISSSLAQEIIAFNLPKCEAIPSDDILEMRHHLASDLQPFRNMILRLTGRIRDRLSEQADRVELKRETEFFVRTDVQPLLDDIRRRISIEKGRLWRRVFGTVIGWVPVGIGVFSDPSGAVLASALAKATKETASLLDARDDLRILKGPGISFLFKLDDALRRST